MTLKEDQHTEFKEKSTSGTIINEIVAFLNTCDGSVYVGIKDDGTIVGIADIDKTSLSISNIIADQIEPNPRGFVTIETPVVDGKHVVRIDIKKGDRLYYIKKYGMSSAGCFERIGTSSRGMTTEQIHKRMIATFKADLKIINLPANKKDLTFKMIKFFYTQEGLTVNEGSFLKNEELLDADGNYNIQAELLADENRFSIKVVRFEGNDKGTKILLRNEYGYQCLIAAMKNAQNFCSEVINQTKTIFHENGYREDVPLFDRGAFREAWYNACLHNDWVDGTPPAIYVFNNRLEIISTGGLPSNMTKDDFFGGISKPVNESLAKIFIKLGLIEQTGHGVSTIVDKYGKEAFTFFDNFLKVTIPFNYNLDSYISSNTIDVPENGAENGAESGAEKIIDELILDAIKNNPKITRIELAKITGKGTTTVYRRLKKMQDMNKIERVGPDKGGHWEIKK